MLPRLLLLAMSALSAFYQKTGPSFFVPCGQAAARIRLLACR
jgi:hypothetical protein